MLKLPTNLRDRKAGCVLAHVEYIYFFKSLFQDVLGIGALQSKGNRKRNAWFEISLGKKSLYVFIYCKAEDKNALF